MRVLIDTNVLLRLGNKSHALHATVRDAVLVLEAEDLVPVIVPQVLYEYWVVATRPTNVNGLGLNCSQADADITSWCEIFKLLLDERGVFSNWINLVRAFNVEGKNAHDARLVSAMLRHQLVNFLTFNKHDFARYQNIHVLSPDEVLSGRRFS